MVQLRTGVHYPGMSAGTSGHMRVLIAGGGVAALEAMIALRAIAGDRVEITLLAPDRDFYYRPLAVAEPFGAGEMQRFDIAELARGCGARYQLGSVVAVNPEERRVQTSRNERLEYDTLLIAIGTRKRDPFPGAVTFRGSADVGDIRWLLSDIEAGRAKRVVFAVPGGVTWSLPLYELALMTAEHVSGSPGERPQLEIVTPEHAPLAVFGHKASEAVGALLAEREIGLRTDSYPLAFDLGELRTRPGPPLTADRVISVPRLSGVRIAGVPQDENSFIQTDSHGRVPGLPGVYAAGDITTFSIKQGGIASQQADAAAECIAAQAGAQVTPRPFEPVLRGLLLTGSVPLFVRAELTGGRGDTSTADADALWWPPSKIAARYMGPYLAERMDSARLRSVQAQASIKPSASA
jgi:sulfide:quinone oxidoreductase